MLKRKIKNIFIFIFSILIISFTESGKKVINNIIYNIYHTYKNIVPDKCVIINFNQVILLKSIIYAICILFCLGYCIYTHIINNRHKRKKNQSETEGKKEVEDYLVEHINNEKISMIFIDGSWGIGKTTYVKNTLKYINRDFYYISLFGLKTREQIISEVINEIKTKSCIGRFLEIPIIGTVVNLIYSINGLNILKTNKKGIIVFDDLERVSGYINSKNEYEAKMDDYNDIIGFLDYFSQNFKEFKIIVIMDSYKMGKIYEKFIYPKLSPQTISVPFYTDIVSNISKEYLIKLKEDKDIIDFYSFIWMLRRELNKSYEWSYRPLVKELQYLSNYQNRQTVVDIALSGLISSFKLPEVSVDYRIREYLNQASKKDILRKNNEEKETENIIEVINKLEYYLVTNTSIHQEVDNSKYQVLGKLIYKKN